MLNSSQAFCKFYKSKQGCRFKNNCRFLHFDSKESPLQSAYLNNLQISDTKQVNLQGHSLNTIISDPQYYQNAIQNDAVSAIRSSVADTSNPKTVSICQNINHDKKSVCHFFARRGWCAYNNRCKFAHLRNDRDVPTEIDVRHPSSYNAPTPDHIIASGELCPGEFRDKSGVHESRPVLNLGDVHAEKSHDEGKQIRENSSSVRALNAENHPRKSSASALSSICQYYMYGYCAFGRHCKFSHSIPWRYPTVQGKYIPRKQSKKPKVLRDVTANGGPISGEANIGEKYVEKEETTLSEHLNPDTTNLESSIHPVVTRSLSDDELRALRTTECEQIKKRLSTYHLEVLSEETTAVYSFIFTPTDPDWPFDVTDYPMKITIPARYPLEIFDIDLISDPTIPEVVAECIEEEISTWLTGKQNELASAGQVELVFRPFLRWCDKNFEEMVTSGLKKYKMQLDAKAAGMEFIPGNVASPPERSLNVYDQKTADGYYGQRSDDVTAKSSENSAASDSKEDPAEVSVSTERRGTEVYLRSMRLLSGVSTLTMDKASVMVECERCKYRTCVTTPVGRVNQVVCGKCNTTQKLVYRGAMCHNFSAVVGYLDLEKCSGFDVSLQDCSFTLSCLNCSKDMKNLIIHPGQLHETWCRSCHSKMAVGIESVRLTQLTHSEITTALPTHNIATSKTIRVPKNPAIQEGKPLPENGTCRHYKKSYRWFRFPCCGKCYPCDVCHEETEGGNHEMKLANRVICGHCAKEQPYSSTHPCIACNSNMTKARSSYWEGGKGCRDKVAMSRNDVHKYKNSGKKTQSNKAKQSRDRKTTKTQRTVKSS